MKRSASCSYIRIVALSLVGVSLIAIAPTAFAAKTDKKDAEASAPALVITNEPLPTELQSQVYNSPARVPTISADQVAGASYFDEAGETVVGRKANAIRDDLFNLQGTVSKLSERLAEAENSGRFQAAEYYASVATISTQLQSGTTPGNPRLIQKLDIARNNLEKLSGNVATLNGLAVEISNAASLSSFLLESARATYSLSGAVEEDHVRLAQLEDSVNSTVVVIERLLNNVNDDITRTVAYLGTERENIRTLSLAITSGDLFGKSLANRPFSSAQLASFSPQATSARYEGDMMAPPVAQQPAVQQASFPAPAAAPMGTNGGPRPLAKIRFDNPNVDYEQPVYMAVNEALGRYPNARFELVAVHPDTGNAAEVAIESTRARRNAEKVLRSLSQMGVALDRIDLSYTPSRDATTNEVHLYVK